MSVSFSLHAGISENASLQEYFEQFDSNLSLAPDEEFGLQHFTYNNSGVLRSIFENIEATAITGITVSNNWELRLIMGTK